MNRMTLDLTGSLLVCMTYAGWAQDTASVTNAVLCEADIQGLKIIRASRRGWWYSENGHDKNGWPLEMPGFYQEAALNGVPLSVRYAAFPSVELAQQGIEFHRKNAAAPFAQRVRDSPILEQTNGCVWYGESGNVTSLLVLSEVTCLLISCHGEDAATRKNACEQVASKIVAKVKEGGHVATPKGKPAPHGKASP